MARCGSRTTIVEDCQDERTIEEGCELQYKSERKNQVDKSGELTRVRTIDRESSLTGIDVGPFHSETARMSMNRLPS